MDTSITFDDTTTSVVPRTLLVPPDEGTSNLSYCFSSVSAGSTDMPTEGSTTFTPEELEACLDFLNKQKDLADISYTGSIAFSPEELQACLDFLNKQMDSADMSSASPSTFSAAELQACLDSFVLSSQLRDAESTSITSHTSTAASSLRALER